LALDPQPFVVDAKLEAVKAVRTNHDAVLRITIGLPLIEVRPRSIFACGGVVAVLN
jgi:hypothetical protein